MRTFGHCCTTSQKAPYVVQLSALLSKLLSSLHLHAGRHLLGPALAAELPGALQSQKHVHLVHLVHLAPQSQHVHVAALGAAGALAAAFCLLSRHPPTTSPLHCFHLVR
jgi:hypothetical protein